MSITTTREQRRQLARDNAKQPTISIKPYKDEQSGEYRVDCTVTGLKSGEQAVVIADLITSILCGEEIQKEGTS